jgi:hypothetical protein
VAGTTTLDEDLGDDVPSGSRIYRAVFVESDGTPTFSSYQATRVSFDNRLEAGEVRTEMYRFVIPWHARESVQLIARLSYLAYPAGFAARLGVARAVPVTVATTTTTVPLR